MTTLVEDDKRIISRKKNLKLVVVVENDIENDCESENFRQNFDLVTPEGDDPDKNSLWGLPVREFVPDTVISWVEHLQDDELIVFHGKNVLKKVQQLNNLSSWQPNENHTASYCFCIVATYIVLLFSSRSKMFV